MADHNQEMNLHFLPDSPYSKWFVERCERLYPGKNTYLSFGNGAKVRFLDTSLVKIISSGSGELASVRKNIRQYKAVYINYLDPLVAHFVLRNRSGLKEARLIWLLWGADFYYLPFLQFDLYQPFAARYMQGRTQGPLIRKIKDIARLLLDKPRYKDVYHAARLMHYCLTPIEEDVKIAARTLDKQYLTFPFSFLSLGEMFSTEQDNASGHYRLGKRTIQIGNSGDPANNHYEIFEKLSALKVDQQVFCPLSYGDEDYIKLLCAQGTRLLGERFDPLTEFLPREAYYNKLKEIDFAIFNHNVQQAFGNILGLLWLGTKVFLNRSNAIYATLKNWGVTVFSIEQDLSADMLAHMLPDDIVEKNRAILFEKFNDEIVDRYYCHMLKIGNTE